jgi:hypothetical protein
VSEAGLHEGVLAHEHLGAERAQCVSDLVELERAHVVNVDEDGLLVLIGKVPELLPVLLLLLPLFRLLLDMSHSITTVRMKYILSSPF